MKAVRAVRAVRRSDMSQIVQSRIIYIKRLNLRRKSIVRRNNIQHGNDRIYKT